MTKSAYDLSVVTRCSRKSMHTCTFNLMAYGEVLFWVKWVVSGDPVQAGYMGPCDFPIGFVY